MKKKITCDVYNVITLFLYKKMKEDPYDLRGYSCHMPLHLKAANPSQPAVQVRN